MALGWNKARLLLSDCDFKNSHCPRTTHVCTYFSVFLSSLSVSRMSPSAASYSAHFPFAVWIHSWILQRSLAYRHLYLKGQGVP